MNDFADVSAAIPLDARDIQYREVRDFRTLSARLHRGYSRLGWTLAVLFAMTTLLCFAGWTLFPTTVVRLVYMEHDRSTGWIGPAVGVHDAPATFGDKEARAALTAYIWARERYTPEIDQTNWAQVRAMTAAQEWPNYDAWVNSRSSPKSRLGHEGHVDIFNLTYSQPLTSPDGTLTYQVRFNRREVRNGMAGEVPVHVCSTQISFRWAPDIIANEQDAQLNPYGMQTIAYRMPECV